MYLRAGLPVVIWDQAVMHIPVRERNVGIAVASLADVDGAGQFDAADYLQMRTNALEMSRQLGEAVCRQPWGGHGSVGSRWPPVAAPAVSFCAKCQSLMVSSIS